MNAGSGPDTISRAARERYTATEGTPLLMADWVGALFLHFEVPVEALGSRVPFEPDLWEGRAHLSLVAFTMRRFRVAPLGRIGEWLLHPIGDHEFLNLRAYVRHAGEPGICFLAEWLPNPVSVWLGPRTYRLPYRRAAIDYQHTGANLRGTVRTPEGRLAYRAECDSAVPSPCPDGSLDQFLMERYTAFNAGDLLAPGTRGTRRLFRVWHEPWAQVPAQVSIADDSLLRRSIAWWKSAKLVGANYSDGVRDVWMSAPHKLSG